MLWAGWTAPGRGRLRGETWSAPAWAPPSRSPPAAGSPAPTMRARCTSPSTCSSRSRARGPRRRGWSCSPGGRRLEPRRPQVSPPGPGPGGAGAGAGGLVGGWPSWTRLSAPQPATSRPSWGPRAPLRTARPRSASWLACPAAPSVSGALGLHRARTAAPGPGGAVGQLCPAEQALSAPCPHLLPEPSQPRSLPGCPRDKNRLPGGQQLRSPGKGAAGVRPGRLTARCPQAAAAAPSLRSTTTARCGCGAGPAGRSSGTWGARRGPASACTTWSWTPQPSPRRVSGAGAWPARVRGGWGPGHWGSK